MNGFARASLLGVLALAAGAASAEQKTPQQMVTGPVATYWMSAETSSGISMGAMGGGAGGRPGGGRPSMGAMMGMMMGGGGLGATHHMLRLQLGSSLDSRDPQAEHQPPAGLGVGASLPLVTPHVQPGEPAPESSPGPEQYQRQKPHGRMLIFWGCGEHARPGQPFVIDFAKMGDNPAGMAQAFSAFKGLQAGVMHPPSPHDGGTYGEWPNERDQMTVPAEGSLAGEHSVQGNYTPDIRFALSPQQDFLAPLTLTTNAPTGSGAVQLAWNPIPGAQAYVASVIGGGQDTVVMWISSESQAAAMAVPDYLSNADQRRMVESGQLMGAQTTSCLVPAEVAQAAPHALVSMTAYGAEANFSDPPRPANPKTPWNIAWTVKARYRATTGGLLGQPMPGAGERPDAEEQRGDPSDHQQRPSLLQGLGGFIPHP